MTILRQPSDWMDLQPCLCSSFRSCMRTTHKISQRLVLCHHRKPDSNRQHIQHRSLRSWTLHERKTHHYSFSIARNHFFLGRPHASMPPLQTQQPSTLSRQWKFAQQLATHIWKRLRKEFIPTLLPRQRWTKKTPPIKIGEIVWILQDMSLVVRATLVHHEDHGIDPQTLLKFGTISKPSPLIYITLSLKFRTLNETMLCSFSR